MPFAHLTLPLVLSLLQGPGDAAALVHAPPREVRRVYWELFKTTEVLVRLVPEDPDGKPAPLSLTFEAFFPGEAQRDPYSGLPKWPEGPPGRLELRAQGNPITVVKDLSLRLVVDGKTWDLTGPGSRYRNVPCLFATDDCSPNGVEVELDPRLFKSMLEAREVAGQALGFPIKLTAADRAALDDFAARIGTSGDKGPSHDPATWVFPQGRSDRERWKRAWEELFRTHELVHNIRRTVRIEISEQGDGGFAFVDVDTLWRNRTDGSLFHWKGRAGKGYTKVREGWLLIFHTGLFDYDAV